MVTDFKRASSVDEAVALARDGYVYLAGGTQVNNTPFKKWGRAVERVVSIDRLGLTGIESKGDAVFVGALTTLQDVADSTAVPGALVEAAWFIPTRSVRNIATIGGNVGASRPDSYIVPALIALGATAEVVGGAGGTAAPEEVPVEQYVSDGRDDLILRFRVPLPGAGVSVRAVKESRSHVALPVVSAAVRIAVDGGAITDAVIAAGCVAPRTVRLGTVESALVAGDFAHAASLGRESGKLEEAIAASIDPKPNILGSTAFKRHVNSVVIADTIRRCIGEATA